MSAALDAPGVVGVLTGADVAALSRPFPAGVESPIPYYAAATHARYAGEPLAVVVARDRYLAEDAVELIEVEYEPLEPEDPERCTTGRSPTATSTRRSTGRRRRLGPVHVPALDVQPGRELRHRVPTGTRPPAR